MFKTEYELIWVNLVIGKTGHKCEKLMIEVLAEGIPVLSYGQSNNNVNGINKYESKIGNLELSG